MYLLPALLRHLARRRDLHHRSRAPLLLLAAAICSIATSARAEEPSKAALAQSLFDEGKALYVAGDYARACPKFQASHELDPKGGTLLNLAMCHEKIGRVASAWAEFAVARDLSVKERRPERVEFAEQRVAALGPMISRVRIDVKVAGDVTVKLDDVIVPRAAWGSPMPIDPGAHAVTARAPSGSFERALRVGEQPSTIDVTIEALTPPPRSTAPAPARPARTVAIVGTAVLAATGVGLGAVFGALAIGKRSDAERLCAAGDCAAGRRANDSGVALAWGANVAFGAAIALALTSAAIWIFTGGAPMDGSKRAALLTF